MQVQPIEMPDELRRRIGDALAREQYARAIVLFNSRPARRQDDSVRIRGWSYIEVHS